MARFYFHQRIGETLIEDPDGYEFSSLNDARASALISARRLWAAAVISDEDLSGEAIEIADECGHHVGTVTLIEALPLTFRRMVLGLEPSKAA